MDPLKSTQAMAPEMTPQPHRPHPVQPPRMTPQPYHAPHAHQTPQPPSHYQGQQASGPPVHPTVKLPRRRFRAVPILALFLIITLVGSAVIAWFAFPVQTRRSLARYGMRTGSGKSRVGAFPISAEGALPRFTRRRVSAPSSPEGARLVTPVYDIEPQSSADPPFEISLPLLHSRISGEEGRSIIVGHYIDGAWSPLPTEMIEDRVWAVTDSFSVFAGWSVPTSRASDTGSSSLRVRSPRMMFGRVRAENVSIHLDIRGLDAAYDPNEPWGDRLAVSALRVEVAQGEGASFTPYRVNGSPLTWQTTEQVGVLPIAVVELPGALRHDTEVQQRPWRLRVVPVFADGSTGVATEPIDVYADVLMSFVWLRRNMPWAETERVAFAEATSENPLGVVFGPYLHNAYNGSVGWSRRRLWGRLRAGIRHPHIGMRRDATWGRVVTHTWGHYAVHMLFGEEYYLNGPTSGPQRWQETSRADAFHEDLATYFGQLGTGRGLPIRAGAMLGLPDSLSRHPHGTSSAAHWPADRDMDAAAVETVSATVMTRISRGMGHGGFLAVLSNTRPNTLPELVDALLPRHARLVQPILLDEGVSWRVTGRVLGAGDTPIAGARISVRSDGRTLLIPAEDRASIVDVSAADGSFTMRVPPGPVELVAERSGLTQAAPVRFTVNTDGPTNGTPAELSDPIRMR